MRQGEQLPAALFERLSQSVENRIDSPALTEAGLTPKAILLLHANGVLLDRLPAIYQLLHAHPNHTEQLNNLLRMLAQLQPLTPGMDQIELFTHVGTISAQWPSDHKASKEVARLGSFHFYPKDADPRPAFDALYAGEPYGTAIFLDLRRIGELPDGFEPEAKAELRIRTRLKLADGSVLAEAGAPVGWSLAEVTPGGWQSDLPRVGPSAEIVRESHSLDFGSEYFVLANIGHAKIQSAPFKLDDASDEVEIALDRPLLVLKLDSLEGAATVRLSTDAPALPSPFGEDRESVSLTKLKEAKQVATLAKPGSLHIVVETDGKSFSTTYEVSDQPLQIIDLVANASDTGSPNVLRQEVMVYLKPRMTPEDMLGRTYLLPASGPDADKQLQSGTLIPSGDYIAVFEPNVGAPVTVPASVGGHGNEQEIVWDTAFAMVEVSFVDRASGRPFAPPGGWQVATISGAETVETFDQFVRGNRNGNKTFSLVPEKGRTYEVRALDSDGTVLGTADVSAARVGEQVEIEIDASPDVGWRAVRSRAEAVLQRLYKEHLARLAKADTEIQVLAHEGLASDLGFHTALASLVTSGELGFDPIIDAQDHDIGEVAVETDENPDDAGRVVATARFTNFGKVQTVRYYLQSGGWEGAEIVDVEGDGWRLSEVGAPRR